MVVRDLHYAWLVLGAKGQLVVMKTNMLGQRDPTFASSDDLSAL